MSANHNGRTVQNAGEPVAMLVRSLPVRLVEVSRGGCRLECARRIESGTSGQLAVELAGVLRVDDIRVARCQLRMGAGAVYQVGAELLRTRRLGRRSVRMAIRSMINGEPDVDHDRNHDQVPVLAEAGTREGRGASDNRAPPVSVDRGS